MKRRDLMKSLALGATGGALASLAPFRAKGQGVAPPRRVVFWTTQHGPPRDTWKMNPAGLGAEGSASLRDLAPGAFSRVLEPLHRVRESVCVLEGLSMMSAMIDRFGSNNNHGVAWSNLLVNQPFDASDPFVGSRNDNLHPRPGGISIDQYIGEQTAGGGRLDSVVWGGSGRFGSRFGFSSNALGQWIVPNQDPADAFRRLMDTGLIVPSGESTETSAPEPTREERLREARFRAYNVAIGHFDRIAPRLSTADQASLLAHRDQLARLGVRFQPGGSSDGAAALAECTPEFRATGDDTADFFRMAALAFACDAVRVIAIDSPQLRGSQIGASDADDVHQAFAHGTNERATRMMENYYRYHADELATFIETLRSIPEGEGTLLDSTLILWIPELATGGHMFDDTPTVIAGGGASGFSPGRYVRFAQSVPTPGCGYGCDYGQVGPGRVHLWVNAMRHMGMSDDGFGRRSATANDGSTIDLTGRLDLVS